jgi:muramoyltetrapeptide carboxypeptidase
MIKIPPYLQKGDTIGIVCPAGYMSLEKAQACINTLEDWGYEVKTGNTLGGNSQNYFSGTDKERLADFQEMLDDDSLKAILCARGGYGVGRIIGKIDFSKFRKHPKWIIGFSDITILHTHIYSKYRIASLHAPMASAFNDGGDHNEFVLSLKNALEGIRAKYQCPPHELNRKGQANSQLVGGNLSLLTHLIGSDSDLDTRGKILFLEDTGEYLYQVDRMFYQLKRSGKLKDLAGLIIGGFSELKDTTRPFGETIYGLIHSILKEYDFPVCFNFPVSHEKANYALKIGNEYTLKIGNNKVRLEE